MKKVISKIPTWAIISQTVIMAIMGLPDVLVLFLPQIEPVLKASGIDLPLSVRASISLITLFLTLLTKKTNESNN
jgi:hypothetical protein